LEFFLLQNLSTHGGQLNFEKGGDPKGITINGIGDPSKFASSFERRRGVHWNLRECANTTTYCAFLRREKKKNRKGLRSKNNLPYLRCCEYDKEV